MYVIQNIDFACNLTHRAAITTIDTWLAGQDALPNDALLERLELVLDVVRGRTAFNGKCLNNGIFDLTDSLVS